MAFIWRYACRGPTFATSAIAYPIPYLLPILLPILLPNYDFSIAYPSMTSRSLYLHVSSKTKDWGYSGVKL